MPMTSVQTGTIDYHNRKAQRVLSWLILIITVVIALAVNALFDIAILTIIVFVAALFLVAAAMVPVDRKFCTHEASYEITPQQLTLHMAKEDLVLKRDEVNGIGCDPVLEKGSRNTNTVNYWKITIQTVPGEGRKKTKYEIYSINSIETDENNQISLRQFQAFGKELKRWFGMIV